MKKRKKDLLRIFVTSILFAGCIFTASALELPWYIELLPYLAVYLLIGYDIILEAVGGIGRGQVFDENFLMVLATVGAFAIGEYPEAVAVMLLYQIGELFQRYAVEKSRGSISDLMELRPDMVRVITEEGISENLPEDAAVGQHILVRPGERIPLDGTVVSGESVLDTSALTGESVPRFCRPGDPVLSGVIVSSGVLEIRVEKVYEDSTVAKILDMVENASGNKAKFERFITRFAAFYTPIVVVLALIQAVIPPVFDGNWLHWMQNSMNFLVISCPCALVISIPLTFYCGIGAASRYGILVKGGNYLEQLSKVNTFVFDKTGTLTHGKFSVCRVVPEAHRDEILRHAAIAEQGSVHPVAQAVLREVGTPAETDWNITEFAGNGVLARKENCEILVGNKRFLCSRGIRVEEIEFLGTVLYVAADGKALGAICIADQLKKDAVSAIRQLKRQGAETVMLTGDRKEAACEIAKQLGIDCYEAELLPGDKVEKVEQLLQRKQKGDVLAFVGDGINDAPVIMRADVGIAMGGIGSDAAIEAADVVLMYDDLSALAVAQKIAKRTLSIVRQNILFALGIKLLVLALTPFGYVSVWMAIFADVGVAVLAILNAMRAARVHKLGVGSHSLTNI